MDNTVNGLRLLTQNRACYTSGSRERVNHLVAVIPMPANGYIDKQYLSDF